MDLCWKLGRKCVIYGDTLVTLDCWYEHGNKSTEKPKKSEHGFWHSISKEPEYEYVYNEYVFFWSVKQLFLKLQMYLQWTRVAGLWSL